MTFILDTSAMTDPRLREQFNVDSLEDVVKNLVDLMAKARLLLGVQFYLTPSMWNELRRFLINNGVDTSVVNQFGAWVIIKAPDKLGTRIPAAVMSEYVEDMRRRILKGLRVAEDAVRKTASRVKRGGHEEEKIVGEIIHDLREKYREALRKGTVDSMADFDAIILALELKGVIVTNDEGIRRLCESLGVIVIDPLQFVETLRRLGELASKQVQQ